METKKIDMLLADIKLKPSGGIKRPVNPRFVSRRQNFFTVYSSRANSLHPRDIGQKVIEHEVNREENVPLIDLELPGLTSKYNLNLVVKKPLLPEVKKWGLRLALSCLGFGLIASGLLFMQSYSNLDHAYKAFKKNEKSFAVLQANVDTAAPAVGSLGSQTQRSVNTQSLDQAVLKEKAPILILNGTPVQGLAASTSTTFKGDGLNIIGVGNAPSNDYSETVVIDLVPNKYILTNNYLDQHYGTTSITSLPNNSIQTKGAAFVIILGSNETINSQS